MKRLIFFMSVVWAGLAFAISASAKTHLVEPGADLTRLFGTLEDGDVVALSPGTYAALTPDAGIAFDKAVTFKSADPERRATIKRLLLQGAENVAFENLHFKYDFRADLGVREPRPFRIENSRNITFKGSVFEGALATSGGPTVEGYPVGKGLWVGDSSNIRVEDSEFFHWFAGAAFNRVNNLIFRGNELYRLRSDGFNCSELQNGLISENYFHDFLSPPRSKDHRDMIQCWSARAERPIDGLTIEGNVLHSGTGMFSQSIFLRNELVDKGLAGPEMYYRSVTIRNNVIINAHRNGIHVGHASGVVIENNTVVRSRASAGPRSNPKLYIPLISVEPASRNVSVRGNILHGFRGEKGQSGWQIGQNYLVQDDFPFRTNHYAQVFASPPERGIPKISDFRLKPGTKLSRSAIGAPMLRP